MGDEGLTNSQYRVAVVMAVHNRRVATMNCLQQLASQTLPVRQEDIFVVDDGSADGTAAAIQESFPDVNVLTGDGSLYWGKAMALAGSAAIAGKADFILWLNDDIQMVPDALERLVDTATSSVERPIVVGALCDSHSVSTTYSGYVRKAGQYGLLRLRRVDPDPVAVQKIETFNGNIVLVPAQYSRQLGGVDPKFTHHYGDLDFGFRASKAGIEILLASGYMGMTDRNPTSGSFRDSKMHRGKRLRNLVGPKGFPPRERLEYFRRHGGALWVVQCFGFYLYWTYKIVGAK